MTIAITPAESVDRCVLYLLKRAHGFFLLSPRRSLMPLSKTLLSPWPSPWKISQTVVVSGWADLIYLLYLVVALDVFL